MSARTAGQAQTAAANSPDGSRRRAAARRSRASDAPEDWRRAAQRYGRYGVWAVPIFALLAGVTQRSAAAFSADPATYARYVATGRYQPAEILTTVGISLFGLVSVVALGALLCRGRGQRFAMVGATAALAGSVTLLVIAGSVIVRAEQIRAPLLRGRLDAMAVTASAKGSAASITVLSGASLLTVGWILLGVAVFRASGMNRADGVLLIISAPLLYVGGMFLRVVPTMGSFLLLAAGLGIAFAAGRVVSGEAAVVPPSMARSAALARFEGQSQAGYAGAGLHRAGAADGGLRRVRGVSTAWSVTRAERRSDNGMPDPSTGPAVTRE